MNGSFNYEPQKQALPPSTWGGTLILCCLAAGVLAAMLEVERSRFKSERDDAKLMATSYEIQQARDEDLGKNLADVRTQVIHLRSPGGAADTASLAYNEPLRWGALFCDGLPPLDSEGEYELWAIGRDGATTELARVRPEGGMSVYAFTWEAEAGAVSRVEINAGKRAAGAAVIFAGSVQ